MRIATANAIPKIFLVVAAFILNIALTRALALQRPQIAALKALGYSDAALAWHYLKWALAVGLLGVISALGVEEQRVNVIVDFVDPGTAARALGDGYRVEVRVVIWREQKVLKVPVGSLFRRGADWAVFVASNGRAHLQPVKLGQRSETEGQIQEGLSAGQRVVMHPPDTLSDGARISARGN